jgi:phosphate transport system permease protein
MAGYLFGLMAIAAVIVYFVAAARARHVRNLAQAKSHSRPVYHGLNAAIWTGVPAFVFLILWLFGKNGIINRLVLAGYPGSDALSGAQQSLLISEIRQVATGNVFREPTAEILVAVEHLKSLESLTGWAVVAVVAALTVFGAFFGLRAIEQRFRARHRVEQAATWFMMFSSLVAILTTLGIIVSLVFEAGQFFARVPVTEFLFGLRWEPQIALRADQVAGQGAFGMIPVIFGTIVISALAMFVAVPVGILSAIYLTEYSGQKFRAVVKPMLEILAGIPTVVYGFFAVLTVAPAMRNLGLSLGIDSSPNSAIAAGGVMGVMIIPFISSLSDDAFAAVPRAMREGSFALGATRGETIRKVLLPAALPGIVGGVLLALSRAIGETMIVVMAAGLIARMTLNPFEAVTTVTVQIVTLLIGDAEFDNPKTLAAFALGLVLFIITLGLNLIALQTVRKYREKY